MKMLLAPLLGLFVVVGNLRANGGGYAKGVSSTSAFQPLNVDQVEMVSELLEINLHIEYADVQVEYVLHNPGKKVTVECGFPAVFPTPTMFVPLPPGGELPEPKALENFRFEADGKEIKAIVRRDDGKLGTGDFTLASWHVVKIPFAAGQTRRVKASYRNPYHQDIHSVSEDWSEGSPTLTYAFSAAALWAGPIKQGTVIVNATSVDPVKVQFSHPKRYVFENGRWTWSFTDFEPTLEDDLVIKTRPERRGFSMWRKAANGRRTASKGQSGLSTLVTRRRHPPSSRKRMAGCMRRRM